MISVCVATYNGSKYILEQVYSILQQLNQGDEIIVCDDNSTDDTVMLINTIDDKRIKLHINDKNIGHVRNFERALGFARGDFVALSDQDDIWLPGRLLKMQKILLSNPEIWLIASNFDLIDNNSKVIGVFDSLNRVPYSRVARIVGIFFGVIPYFGCTFFMTRELLHRSLPFPKKTEAHDIWLALLANTYGNTYHMIEPTLKRRIHGGNLTPRSRRNLTVILASRLRLFIDYLSLFLRPRYDGQT